ncbi:ATP-binding protein [Companilactobacillus ginsenosidimutans]|uniref:YhaN AAA domain-containing protein n=1 Tax=Companilactobacillus ginsenosidimutans TaxID=1007676 RepID=A0A0H4QEH5_9LACO|nr:AAA family ATPase [Companilactobacillus ginsenosidimutans]AKP66784.1 hypothetical protein ABM34_03845 [Companilactobacillus ginsenosidimutans]
MKLIKAKIYGFGKWIDQEFNINQDYQIIFGNNEAGKTTFLTFVKSILFGFASARGTSKYEQYKPKNGSSYGGELEFLSENGNHWIVRRVDGKSESELTLFRDDQEVPATLMTEITKGFTKDDFENTHVLNEQTIRSVYDLDETRLETEILALGATGSKQWLQTADDLENDSGDIYKPRGQKQPLTQSIKRYDELHVQRSEYENQQQQYQKISRDLQSVNSQYEQLELQYQQQISRQKYLHALNQKLPKYRELLQLKSKTNINQNIISSEDWENFLKLNQQVDTLSKTNIQQIDNEITPQEDAFMDNYYSNQADIDYIQNKKNDIQNIIFQNEQNQNQLRKSNYQSDQLLNDNPGLHDNMSLLSNEEISKLNKTDSTSNVSLPIIVGVVCLILLLFVPNLLKVVVGIGILGSIGWWFYLNQQSKDESVKQEQMKNEILAQHNSAGSSVQQVIELQPKILQLNNLRDEQHALENKISRSIAELNKWNDLFIKVGILEKETDPNNYIPEMDAFYNQLNATKAKFDLIEQNKKRQSQILNSSNRDINSLRQSIFDIVKKYDVANTQAFIDLHQQQINNQMQIDKLKADREYIGADISHFETVSDLNSIPNELNELNNQIKDTESQRNEFLTKKGYLESQLKQVFDDKAYQSLVEELAQCKQDMLDQYDEWLSDKLASRWIHEMLNLASESRYPKMLSRAKQYFAILTNGNYVDISMNKQKRLSLTRSDKIKFDVHELSKATTVQLYISLRLAFVVEISDIVDLPILIDDAFVDFDKARSESVFKLIRNVAKDNQIIFVTANLNPNLQQSHILNLEGANNG